MEDILQKMDPDKREALIKSALKEFGSNPFDKASTNIIVKEAGISKGLLYHYFSSKESLYDYLIDFFFSKSLSDLMGQFDIDEPDIMERILGIIKIKMTYIKQYPSMIDFAKVFYRNHTMEDAKLIISKYLTESVNDFYKKNVDYSLFKENVDVPMVLNIVQWTMEKIAEDFANSLVGNQNASIEDAFKKSEEYILEMKKAFYR